MSQRCQTWTYWIGLLRITICLKLIWAKLVHKSAKLFKISKLSCLPKLQKKPRLCLQTTGCSISDYCLVVLKFLYYICGDIVMTRKNKVDSPTATPLWNCVETNVLWNYQIMIFWPRNYEVFYIPSPAGKTFTSIGAESPWAPFVLLSKSSDKVSEKGHFSTQNAALLKNEMSRV